MFTENLDKRVGEAGNWIPEGRQPNRTCLGATYWMDTALLPLYSKMHLHVLCLYKRSKQFQATGCYRLEDMVSVSRFAVKRTRTICMKRTRKSAHKSEVDKWVANTGRFHPEDQGSCLV